MMFSLCSEALCVLCGEKLVAQKAYQGMNKHNKKSVSN
ncbi:hypothetical protein GARC_1615 [Paraglaciecola arctica BSs20135]|uniref:Uncharacterized protein n=1 Tax=Paraglaciecola arctica BSs20135 TaxID=493475 RepID=K6YK73_9ALTE|nr:hypothetical protein GARC_1615 [Paraglaciecola arctica BSs20135]